MESAFAIAVKVSNHTGPKALRQEKDKVAENLRRRHLIKLCGQEIGKNEDIVHDGSDDDTVEPRQHYDGMENWARGYDCLTEEEPLEIIAWLVVHMVPCVVDNSILPHEDIIHTVLVQEYCNSSDLALASIGVEHVINKWVRRYDQEVARGSPLVDKEISRLKGRKFLDKNYAISSKEGKLRYEALQVLFEKEFFVRDEPKAIDNLVKLNNAVRSILAIRFEERNPSSRFNQTRSRSTIVEDSQNLEHDKLLEKGFESLLCGGDDQSHLYSLHSQDIPATVVTPQVPTTTAV